MDLRQIQTEKLVLIDLINQINDFSFLEKIKTFMLTQEKCNLTISQKNAVDESLESIKKFGTISHDIVMAEAKVRYPHLHN